jgi:hypothetical protein
MTVEVCEECDIADCRHIRARRAEEAKKPPQSAPGFVTMVPLVYHDAAMAAARAGGERAGMMKAAKIAFSFGEKDMLAEHKPFRIAAAIRAAAGDAS